MKLIIKEVEQATQTAQAPTLDDNLRKQIKNLMVNKALPTADAAVVKGYAAALDALNKKTITQNQIVGYAAGAAEVYAKPMLK